MGGEALAGARAGAGLLDHEVDVHRRLGQLVAEQARAHEESPVDRVALIVLAEQRDQARVREQPRAAVGVELDAHQLGALDALDAVERGQVLVDVELAGGEERREAPVALEEDRLDEAEQRVGERLADRRAVLGVDAGVAREPSDAVDLEPLLEEGHQALAGARVLEHAPRLVGEALVARQPPLFGGGEELRVGHRAPEEVREPVGELMIVERDHVAGAARVRRQVVEEARAGERSGDHPMQAFASAGLGHATVVERAGAGQLFVRDGPAVGAPQEPGQPRVDAAVGLGRAAQRVVGVGREGLAERERRVDLGLHQRAGRGRACHEAADRVVCGEVALRVARQPEQVTHRAVVLRPRQVQHSRGAGLRLAAKLRWSQPLGALRALLAERSLARAEQQRRRECEPREGSHARSHRRRRAMRDHGRRRLEVLLDRFHLGRGRIRAPPALRLLPFRARRPMADSKIDFKPRTAAWRKSVPYRKYAFQNVYNYTLMGGVAATALLTQEWWLLVVGGGLELLWMVFAPDSPLLQRLWFDKVHDAKLADIAQKVRDELMAGLSDYDRDRVEALENKRASILAMCAQNQAFTMDLLRSELEKLDQLTASFLDLTALTHRQRSYLATVDLRQLDAEITRYEAIVEEGHTPDVRKLAQQNLAVVLKRKDKLQEIHLVVVKALGQMELIENTFELLADQIVTMRSPKELGGQLDDLIDGVEAVKSTALETQGLMEAAT